MKKIPSNILNSIGWITIGRYIHLRNSDSINYIFGRISPEEWKGNTGNEEAIRKFNKIFNTQIKETDYFINYSSSYTLVMCLNYFNAKEYDKDVLVLYKEPKEIFNYKLESLRL